MKVVFAVILFIALLSMRVLGQNGCTDTLACNYDSAALVDDGSCLFIGGDCPDGHPATFIDATCTCVSPEDAVFVIGQMVEDCGGNSYHTVIIDAQEWFAENLRTECFSNGEPIQEVADSIAWITAGNDSMAARVKYENSDSLASRYGFLYNGFAMRDERGVCPTGWHVPASQEFRSLVASSDTLDGVIAGLFGNDFESASAADVLKDQIDWSGGEGVNTSGISAVPSGKRKTNAAFADVGVKSYWWCADGNPGNLITRGCRTIGASDTLFREDANLKWGCAIRCVRDLISGVDEVSPLHIGVYPNPGSHEVNVLCNGFEGGVGVEILDTQGRLLLSQQGFSPRVKLDIRGISTGIYTVRVFQANRAVTERLIIRN